MYAYVCMCACVCVCVCACMQKIGLFGNWFSNSRLTKSKQIESFITFSVNRTNQIGHYYSLNKLYAYTIAKTMNK